MVFPGNDGRRYQSETARSIALRSRKQPINPTNLCMSCASIVDYPILAPAADIIEDLQMHLFVGLKVSVAQRSKGFIWDRSFVLMENLI